MEDRFQREINYLRVSVTDRCNLRCLYCMPAEGVPAAPREEILTLEEIARVVRASTRAGVRKVRLTGGEPLVRRGIERLVYAIARIPEIDDLALTTNGLLLPSMAAPLKEAGLRRVNISLDSLRPDRYAYITRGGDLKTAWQGVEKALELGLHPVKLNAVVVRGFNDDEILDLARLTLERPLHVRFIELMPFGHAAAIFAGGYVPAAAIKAQIESEFGPLQEVRKLKGSGPARYYRAAGAAGTIGFISAVGDHICRRCNRLRLTASGSLRPCLFGEHEIDLKALLRRGAGDEELAALIARAIKEKPPAGHIRSHRPAREKAMSQLGG